MAEKISQQLEEIKNALHNLRTEIEANSIVSISRKKIQPKYSRFAAQKPYPNLTKSYLQGNSNYSSKKNDKPKRNDIGLSNIHQKHSSQIKGARPKLSIYPQKYKYDFDFSDDYSTEDSFDYSETCDSDLSEDSFDVDSYLNAHRHSVGSSFIDDDSLIADLTSSFDSNSLLDDSDEDDSIPSIKTHQKNKPSKYTKNHLSKYSPPPKHNHSRLNSKPKASSKPRSNKYQTRDICIEDDESDLNDDESVGAILSKLDIHPKIKTYDEYDDDSDDDLIHFKKPVSKAQNQTKPKKNNLDDISLNNLSYDLEESIEELPQPTKKKSVQTPYQQPPANKYENSSEFDIEEYLNQRRREEKVRQQKQKKQQNQRDRQNHLNEIIKHFELDEPLPSESKSTTKPSITQKTGQTKAPALLDDIENDDEDNELDDILDYIHKNKNENHEEEGLIHNLDVDKDLSPDENQNEVQNGNDQFSNPQFKVNKNEEEDILSGQENHFLEEESEIEFSQRNKNVDDINDENLNSEPLSNDEINNQPDINDEINSDEINNDKINDEIDHTNIIAIPHNEEEAEFSLGLDSQGQSEENQNYSEKNQPPVIKNEEEEFDLDAFIDKGKENDNIVQQSSNEKIIPHAEEEEFDVDQFIKEHQNLDANPEEDDIDIDEFLAQQKKRHEQNNE